MIKDFFSIRFLLDNFAIKNGQIMQKLCKNYAKIMQKLCKNYAKIMQKLCKNYAKLWKIVQFTLFYII